MKRPPHQRSARVQLGDYSFTKKGVSRFDWTDPYHVAVSLTWPQFFASLLGVYLTVNVLFAGLYTIVPGSIANAKPYDFLDAFFFSFETLATVGYGEMYPGSLYGHFVACAEITSGISFTAILTGLTFVRFARPRAKFVFAKQLVVTSHNGVPTLMARVGNGRAIVLSDARARLSVLLSETTAEGATFRRAHDLRLQRAHIPIFPLTWTLIHTIDDKSALRGFNSAAMIAADARVFLSFEARDPSLAATVQEVRSYPPSDVVFGMRYADVIDQADDGTPIADLTRISDLEPDIGVQLPFAGWAEEEESEA
jgi:inward rectifier potassium channel